MFGRMFGEVTKMGGRSMPAPVNQQRASSVTRVGAGGPSRLTSTSSAGGGVTRVGAGARRLVAAPSAPTKCYKTVTKRGIFGNKRVRVQIPCEGQAWQRVGIGSRAGFQQDTVQTQKIGIGVQRGTQQGIGVRRMWIPGDEAEATSSTSMGIGTKIASDPYDPTALKKTVDAPKTILRGASLFEARREEKPQLMLAPGAPIQEMSEVLPEDGAIAEYAVPISESWFESNKKLIIGVAVGAVALGVVGGGYFYMKK